MYKSRNVEIYKYTKVEIYKYTKVEIYKYTKVEIYKYTNIQIYIEKRVATQGRLELSVWNNVSIFVADNTN